eukprot:scaffold9188_cov112-Cylindrotheca_fusiformis.AAC.2
MRRRSRQVNVFLFLAFTSFLYTVSTLFRLHKEVLNSHSDFFLILDDGDVGDGPPEFSACLLFNDDSHFLVEWLAYHWTKLPLRRLIIAVDPLSRANPEDSLRHWKRFMNISLWEDDSYFSKIYRSGILRSPELNETSMILVNMHRQRQKIFYWKCMEQLKDENRDWVAFVDTDELLFPNYDHWKHQSLLSKQDKTVAVLLRRLRYYKTLSTPCIAIPRILYGCKDEGVTFNSGCNQSLTLSLGINASDFMSFRWRWHTGLDHQINKAGKSIIDLSRVPRDLIVMDNVRAHRPIQQLCSSDAMWTSVKDSPLVLHHYVGTQKQWMVRDDVRGKRNIHSYMELANVNTTKDTRTHTWLDDFVEEVGMSQAKLLLRDIGRVDDSLTRQRTSPEEKLERLLTLLYKKKGVSNRRQSL